MSYASFVALSDYAAACPFGSDNLLKLLSNLCLPHAAVAKHSLICSPVFLNTLLNYGTA